jgi:hypothetical protein
MGFHGFGYRFLAARQGSAAMGGGFPPGSCAPGSDVSERGRVQIRMGGGWWGATIGTESARAAGCAHYAQRTRAFGQAPGAALVFARSADSGPGAWVATTFQGSARAGATCPDRGIAARCAWHAGLLEPGPGAAGVRGQPGPGELWGVTPGAGFPTGDGYRRG